MYKFVKTSSAEKDKRLPDTVINPYYNIESLPNSDGTYSGWIYLDEHLVEEIRGNTKEAVLGACESWCYSRYIIVEW